ncbi:MAG: hypothetical protein IPK98_01075 [Chloracidobacterium sp.]|nr:hypothetical protein [Chloracidobacterium sp.]
MNMTEDLEKLKRAIESGTKVISLSGLTSIPAKAYMLTKLRAETGKRFAIVTESNQELESWESDLGFFQSAIRDPQSAIVTLPSFEADPYSGISPHAETQEQRALGLWQLANDNGDFAILTARSLIQRSVTPDQIAALGCVLVRDEDMPPEELVERLFACGYVREEPLFGPGQLSVRGQDLKDWAFFAAERFGDEKFKRNLKDRIDFAANGETFSGWEFFMPLVKPLTANVFDHLKDHILVIDEPVAVEHTLINLYEHLTANFEAITESGDVGLTPNDLFLMPEELRELLETRSSLELRALGRTAAATDEEFAVGDATDTAPSFFFDGWKSY